MKKIALVFSLFLVLLGISGCSSDVMYYSPILEKNNLVFYQYKQFNPYLDQYANYFTFEDLSEIQYDNFTMIIIDRDLGEDSIELFLQLKKMFLKPSKHKIMCIYYESKKIKYKLINGFYVNYRNTSLKYGEYFYRVGFGLGEGYFDPAEKYIAYYCLNSARHGVESYMQEQ